MGFFRSSGIVNGKGFFGAVAQAQAFVPTDISGCKLWVSADYGVTYNNNNNVSSWSDRSGNANNILGDIENETAPIYVSSGINNLPTIEFDGTKFMENTLFINLNQFHSIFIVFKLFFDPGALLTNGAGNYIAAITNNSVNFSSSNEFQFLSGGDVLDNNSYYLTSINSNFEFTAFLNSSNVASSNYNEFSGDGTNLYIGADYNYGISYNFNGQISEIIIYDNAVSVENRLKVEQYVKTKYQLQA